MISINARKTSPDTISEASFSYLSEKNVDRKLLEATWKHPCFRGSQRQNRAASKASKRACASEREKERHRKGGGRVKRGRGRMRAKSGGMSLVSSCLHKAAPHQIAFVLNIWIGGYGLRARWLEGMPREKEKGSGYNTPYPTQEPPRPTRTYDKERKGERTAGMESKSKTERELHGIRHNSFPRYSPVSGANTPTPFSPPNLPYESALRPTSSILPAARYRLPNNLTDCSALATSGIRVLVSFQNLSEYPAILM